MRFSCGSGICGSCTPGRHPFAGLITAGPTLPIPHEPTFLRAVQANMAAVGIPLLGHVQHARWGPSAREEPLGGQIRALTADDEGIKGTAQALLQRWTAIA